MSQKIFYIFTTLLKIVGVNLNHMTYFAYIHSGFVILLTVLWCAFNILDIYTHWKTVDDLGKGIVLPLSLRVFYNMVNFVVNFRTWKSIFAVCQTFKSEQVKVSLQILSLIKVYILMATLALTAFIMVPLLQGKVIVEQYPFCDFSQFKCYLTVNIVEGCYLTLLVSTILAYDILYMYLILAVYFETEELKEDIMKIDVSVGNTQVTQNSLYGVVNRHLKVIRLSLQMRNVYCNMLMFQYLATTLSTCVFIFLLCLEGIPPTLERIVQNVFPLTAVLLQLIVYCLGGSILKHQGLSISDAIFETNWWTKTQPSTRRTLAMMIQISQKPTILTIGEVMELGLESVVQALSTSMSIFTLIRNIQEL